MNVVARHRNMRLEDSPSWEARHDVKYEFDGFEPVAMPGGTATHAAVQRNLALAIGSRLRNHRCAFYGSDLKVVTYEQVASVHRYVILEQDRMAATVWLRAGDQRPTILLSAAGTL